MPPKSQQVLFKEKTPFKFKFPTVEFRRAIRCGDVHTVEKCLDVERVNPNALFVGKQTALHIVAEHGMYEIAKRYTLKSKPETNTIRYRADIPEYISFRLLANRKTKIDPVSLHGFTPLMLASQVGNIQMMQLLLHYKAQKGKQDFHGRTILHWTVLQRNLYATYFLLRNRFDPNVMDIYGHTPLYLAATVIANFQIVRILLKYKADPLMSDCPNLNSFFELCLVANSKDHENILRYMLRYIPNVNILSGKFRMQCALHMVAITNYLPVAKILLDKGAHCLQKDLIGRTPIDLATALNNREMVYFLTHYSPADRGLFVHVSPLFFIVKSLGNFK